MASTPVDIKTHQPDAPAKAERIHTRRTFLPRTDIYETENQIVVLAEMPGVDEEGVDITLEKGVLTLRGEMTSLEFEGKEPSVAEYSIGDYERSFTLSDRVEREGIEASMRNGVLRLLLPKAAEAQVRKIPVKSG